MTLKQLEAFCWAATAANFLLAAEHLHVTQSTLSKRIAELEADLGVLLFDRTGLKATLTDAGTQLLPMAQGMLRMSDDIRGALGVDGGQLKGHCRFGMGELSALTWLPAFVSHVRREHPDLMLEPQVDLGATLERRLEDGELDFAVIAGYSARERISSERIADMQFVWAAAPEIVGRRRVLTRAMLETCPIVTAPPAAGPARMMEQWLAVNDFKAGRRLICNNFAAVARLIAAGIGIGLYPKGWLRQLSSSGAVVELTSRPALPLLHYTFQTRRDDGRPLVEQMKKAVLATVDLRTPSPLW
ncbi:MAG: LysR family transcriptional regulator [Variovorax sp.]|jgi:DNA-binding transcriptional LysR family regulator|nr:MAG: LysR family transcriptional regulator [Variovorax sp.]